MDTSGTQMARGMSPAVEKAMRQMEAFDNVSKTTAKELIAEIITLEARNEKLHKALRMFSEEEVPVPVPTPLPKQDTDPDPIPDFRRAPMQMARLQKPKE